MATVENEMHGQGSPEAEIIEKNDTQLFCERVAETLDTWTNFRHGHEGQYPLRKFMAIFEDDLSFPDANMRSKPADLINTGISQANQYKVFPQKKIAHLFFMDRDTIQDVILYSYTRKKMIDRLVASGNKGSRIQIDPEEILMQCATELEMGEVHDRMLARLEAMRERKKEIKGDGTLPADETDPDEETTSYVKPKTREEESIAKFIPEIDKDVPDWTIEEVNNLLDTIIKKHPLYKHEDFNLFDHTRFKLSQKQVSIVEFIRSVDQNKFDKFRVNNPKLSLPDFMRSLFHLKHIILHESARLGRPVTTLDVFRVREDRARATIFTRKRELRDQIEELKRGKEQSVKH